MLEQGRLPVAVIANRPGFGDKKRKRGYSADHQH